MEPIALFAFLLDIESVKVKFYIGEGPEKKIWGCKVGNKRRTAIRCELQGAKECLAIIHSKKIEEWRAEGVIKGDSICVQSISFPNEPPCSLKLIPCE